MLAVGNYMGLSDVNGFTDLQLTHEWHSRIRHQMLWTREGNIFYPLCCWVCSLL